MSNVFKKTFEKYQKVTKKSITETSVELGWSPAALGLYLTGARKIPREHLIRASNFFGVDPRDIDPTYEYSRMIKFEVGGTLSGNIPIQNKKLMQTPIADSKLWIIDCWIEIEEGADCAPEVFFKGNYFPLHSSIVVSKTMVENDPSWPVNNLRYWLFTRGLKRRLILNRVEPKIRNWQCEGLITRVFFD